MTHERTNWSIDRVVTLTMLAAAGGDADEIAQVMKVSPGSVRDAARRFSVPLRKRAAPSCAVGRRLFVISVPEDAVGGLEAAALAREIEPHALIAELATVAGREGTGFIGNVLDDGGQEG